MGMADILQPASLVAIAVIAFLVVRAKVPDHDQIKALKLVIFLVLAAYGAHAAPETVPALIADIHDSIAVPDG